MDSPEVWFRTRTAQASSMRSARASPISKWVTACGLFLAAHGKPETGTAQEFTVVPASRAVRLPRWNRVRRCGEPRRPRDDRSPRPRRFTNRADAPGPRLPRATEWCLFKAAQAL